MSAALAIALLAAIAFGVTSALGLEQPWLQPWSVLRAVVQLGLLTLVLKVAIEEVAYVVAFLVVMVLAAASLVGRRLGWGWRRTVGGAGVIAASAAVPVLVVFGSGAVALQPNLVLAVGGIVVGGVMTVSTLFGRTLADRYRSERDQIEGWLALGATPRQAAASSVRAAGSLALLPATDQTRATGIVTLPGAFVGAVFAGLPVLEAATFQVVVLASLLAAGAIAVALWTLILGAPLTLPADRPADPVPSPAVGARTGGHN